MWCFLLFKLSLIAFEVIFSEYDDLFLLYKITCMNQKEKNKKIGPKCVH